MREIAWIDIRAKEAGSELFSALLRVYPENEWRTSFGYRGPLDDPRTAHILQILTDSRRIPWVETSRPMDGQKEFAMRLERKYDPGDLVVCRFLELLPPSEACNYNAVHRRASGEIMLPLEQMPGGTSGLAQPPHPDGFDFMFGMPNWHFVPIRVKKILESGGFRELKFRATFLMPEHPTPDDIPDRWREKRGIPYWEIDSDLTLPAVSPSMTLTDSQGQPVKSGNFANGFHRRDGMQMYPELHYRASDLKAMEPFDLARAYESFSNATYRELDNRPLVVSQRFYRFCTDHGLVTGWVPERVDPGPENGSGAI